MKITLISVMSLNGYITQGSDAHVEHWASPEDSAHFRTLIAESDAIIMGRTTFEASNPTPEPGTLRLVLTRAPDAYTERAVQGSLEFMDASPSQIAADLTRRGYGDVMLAGGSQVNRAFLDARLVDEMLISVEPIAFGSGTPLFAEGATGIDSSARFQLTATTLLNDAGTLLLHYRRQPDAITQEKS